MAENDLGEEGSGEAIIYGDVIDVDRLMFLLRIQRSKTVAPKLCSLFCVLFTLTRPATAIEHQT
jgi:hypothetical protein